MKRTMRIVLALFLVLALGGGAWAFTDTAGLSGAQLEAVDYLTERGVIDGYTDDTFRPHNPVTRAEFAKMICVFAGYGELAGGSQFSDVADGVWYTGWVNQAANRGLVQGNADGAYLPGNEISQQELATILLRLAGLDETAMSWPDDYVAAALERGLDQGFTFNATASATRIVACQMLYNLAEPAEAADLTTGTLRGIVTAITDGSVTIQDIDGQAHTLSSSGVSLPSGLILGAYLDVVLTGEQITEVQEAVIPRRGTAYWDISRDGQTLTIEGENYTYADAEIYAVTYTINQSYSNDSFVSGGAANLEILAAGDVMGADMAVLIDAGSSRIRVAYLVNANVSLTSGRIGVVDSFYSSGGGSYLNFMGSGASLPVSSSVSHSGIYEGVLVWYDLGNDGITTLEPLLDLSRDYAGAPSGGFSRDADEIAGFVSSSGNVSSGSGSAAGVTSEVVSHNRGSSITLGSGAVNYPLARDCLYFEYDVDKDQVSQGSSRSVSEGDQVVALVTNMSEVLMIFVIID